MNCKWPASAVVEVEVEVEHNAGSLCYISPQFHAYSISRLTGASVVIYYLLDAQPRAKAGVCQICDLAEVAALVR